MWHGVVLTIALSEMKALLITTLYKYIILYSTIRLCNLLLFD